MTTQEDVTEESASESENISEGDADDEDAGEESSQSSLLTSQESEPLVSALPRAGPAIGEARRGAQDELKAASEMCAEDMEVALSEVALAVGGLTPMSSQDTVIIHTTEEEVRSLD